MSAPSKKTPKKQINIELPADLEPRYANFAFISHSPAEIVIDFAQVLPRTPKGKIQSRIVMTPMHAKLLPAARTQNLSQFESKYGAIKTYQGPSLADQLFRQTPSPEDKE